MTKPNMESKKVRKELSDILYFQGRWKSSPAEGERWTTKHRHEYRLKRLMEYLDELGVIYD